MIVVCTSCQAKFRIPDEKVGAKGAKVRCSKCKTVFVVKRDVEAPAPPPIPEPDPFAIAAARAAEPDPFAAAPDPSAAQAAPDPSTPPVGDPFAPAASEITASHLPLTDLSDLAGGSGATGGGLAALAPPLPPPRFPDPLPRSEPKAAAPPPLPAAVPDLSGDAGLALEESTSAASLVPGSADFAGFDPLGSQKAADDDASGLELGGDLYKAGGAPEPSASPEITAEVRDEEPPRLPRPIPPSRPPVVAARPSTVAGEAAPEPAAGPSRSRLRTVLVNSFSLAVLLLVTVGLLLLSQGDGTLVRRRQGVPPPVVASRVTNGLYETARGRVLLFVRGTVSSQSAAPIGRVVVRAEILRGGQVVASAEALAGAVPTPEELSGVAGQDDADRLRASLAPRAQREIRPGESVPFLLTFTDYPPDLGEVMFRVIAEPASAHRG